MAFVKDTLSKADNITSKYDRGEWESVPATLRENVEAPSSTAEPPALPPPVENTTGSAALGTTKEQRISPLFVLSLLKKWGP